MALGTVSVGLPQAVFGAKLDLLQPVPRPRRTMLEAVSPDVEAGWVLLSGLPASSKASILQLHRKVRSPKPCTEKVESCLTPLLATLQGVPAALAADDALIGANLRSGSERIRGR